ncbi:MAG TPA: ubiquitin-like small modifier protein 1 [Anaerolineaceae bacterium]|nr:ubiquitin-like small modifier protein 1 [Anaerolineaceae bacterium]
MQVNFYATFRALAGARRIEIDLPVGATLRQAVSAIVSAYPALERHWLDEAGQIHSHVHGLVNGQEAATLPAGWDTPLAPSDVLDFFPPVAGGIISRQ